MESCTAISKRDPVPDMVQACLYKILSSELFIRSVRHSRFLRFTVEETLAGRGSTLNQYVLGRKVFDCKETFDPKSDLLVRMSAVRLRAKLKAYYETEGQEDSVVISFPRGFAPVFSCRNETAEKRQSDLLRLPRGLVAPTRGLMLSVRTASARLLYGRGSGGGGRCGTRPLGLHALLEAQ